MAKIELAANVVRHLLHLADEQVGDGGAYRAERNEARSALAKHEQEKNPLGLPWGVADESMCGTKTGTFGVYQAGGYRFATNLPEDKAKLIAAAPKLADLIARTLNGALEMPAMWWADEARQLLKDAGWPHDNDRNGDE